MKINEQLLIEKAIEARNNAYAPYSKFTVGAAIICRNGNVYAGCNIENAAYPVGTCAERVALGTAILAGERDFVAIAVVGGKDEERVTCTPCGMCRQALSEFVNGDFVFIVEENGLKSMTMTELLPHRFDL